VCRVVLSGGWSRRSASTSCSGPVPEMLSDAASVAMHRPSSSMLESPRPRPLVLQRLLPGDVLVPAVLPRVAFVALVVGCAVRQGFTQLTARSPRFSSVVSVVRSDLSSVPCPLAQRPRRPRRRPPSASSSSASPAPPPANPR